jgi:N-methylhydantoinase B/oxoprolinase/acetone carboxylase alpha subunit
MIKPKDLHAHINALSQMADLVKQMERQVDFWRTQARNQMKKNTESTVRVTKSDLKYSELTESYYYEECKDSAWWIYDENMYSFNLKETLTLIKIESPDGCNIGVLV